MQIAVGLVNESQVGDSLARAVEEGRRGDFGLILAMLSQDARDFAEFCIAIDDSDAQKLDRRFELPPRQALVSRPNEVDCIDNSGIFRTFGKTSFRLNQALLPEPLVIRGELATDMLIALNNCEPHVRRRFFGEQIAPMDKLMHFNDVLEAQRSISKLMATA